MNATLTIRLDKKHRDALKKRADAERKSESEVARDLLAAGLEESPVWEDIGDLLGSIKLPKESTDPLKKRIRKNNWRK